MTQPGKVYLVGAGPGDPGLITVRGAQCLRRADVVVYDYLVNPRLLDYAPAGAERVRLGQPHQESRWEAPRIAAELAARSEQGQTVVRLKGGDPTVFGRLAEEVGVLLQRGLPLEIVPGVTAGLAAAACAGVPATHRDLASAVALVAGREKSTKRAPLLDYAALARFPGTLVIYMAGHTAGQWAGKLIGAGKPPGTPVALVRRASLPDQQTVRTTLARVAAGGGLQDQALEPPVVAIVGEVAAVEHAAPWFERRPLFGRTVLVTRPAHQAESLARPLEELGAKVVLQPTIQILPPANWTPVDRALDRLDEFDWLVFSSANGVRSLLDRLWERGRDLRALASVRLAAIGPGTRAALEQFHLRVDVQASEHRAEGLAAALADQAPGRRFLLARASRGRETLAEGLRAAGGQVEQIVVYESRDVATPDAEPAALMRAGRVDWVTVTSSAIARSLAAMFGDSLRQCRLASISPVTSATLGELGLKPAAEARRYTIDGVIEAMLDAERG